MGLVLVVVGLAAGAAACAGAAGDRGGAAAAHAEFLVSAGDSTWWVTSDGRGARVRGAPLLLARWDGRFAEVYVADQDRSFEDAVFTAARLYRRDLLTGDSVPLYEDPRVDRAAARYAAAHPDEAPLEADEGGSDEPGVSLTADVTPVAVHGPYVTIERHLDDEREGRLVRHELRRTVLDLRTGAVVTPGALVGAGAVRALADEARRRLAQAVDSLRAASDATALDDEALDAARAALGTLALDTANFGLAAVEGAPAIAWVARGHAADGDVTLALPPLPIPGAPPAWWAREVAPTLPAWTRDSGEVRWASGRRTLRGRVDGPRAALALAVDPRAGELAIGQLPARIHAFVPLDAPPVDAATRRALRRAFDESAFYDDVTTSVAWRRPRPTP